MFNLSKQVFIVLLNFSSSLAREGDRTKHLSINDKPCMVKPTVIDLNPTYLKYYPSMISLYKCIGSFVTSYLQKYVF